MKIALSSASRAGVAQAVGAAALFGLSTPLAKLFLDSANPVLVAGVLYLGSGVGLGLYALARRLAGRPPAEAPLHRRDLPWLAGAIVCGGIAAPALLMSGLARTPASSASLLLNLEAVFTALLAWLVFREHIDRRTAAGLALVVAGGALLSWQGRLVWAASWGPLAIAAACLGWAADNNLTRRIAGGDPIQIATAKGLLAAAANVVLALAAGARLPAPPALAAVALVGLAGYGVSLTLFVLALRNIGAARTGAYFSLAPFLGAAAALLFLKEYLTWAFLGAAALMAAGAYLLLTERHLHTHAHEELEHDHRHIHDVHHRHHHEGEVEQPHAHPHRHRRLTHAHPHYPDLHHRHGH